MTKLIFVAAACAALAPGIVSAAGEAAVVRQMFQECINSGGRAASTYNDWVAQNGCICGGTGSGARTCRGGSRSSSGSRMSGGSVGEVIGTQLGNAIGDLLVCQMFGQNCPPGMQKTPDNPAARAQYQQTNQERETLVNKATEDEMARAREAADRARAVLSNGDGGLQPRDLGATSDLQVEKVQSTFGTNVMKPVFGASRPVTLYQTATLGPLKQLRCAAALMKMATNFLNPMNVYDRYNASEAASNYLSGAPSSMPCNDSDLESLVDVPTPTAVAVQSKQVEAQSKIFMRVVKEQADVTAMTQDIQKIKEKEKDAVEEKTRAQLKVKTLRQDPSPEDPVKKSALAEALRALEESDRVLKDSEKLLADKESQRDKVKKDLATATGLYTQVTNNPGDADNILSQIN